MNQVITACLFSPSYSCQKIIAYTKVLMNDTCLLKQDHKSGASMISANDRAGLTSTDVNGFNSKSSTGKNELSPLLFGVSSVYIIRIPFVTSAAP